MRVMLREARAARLLAGGDLHVPARVRGDHLPVRHAIHELAVPFQGPDDIGEHAPIPWAECFRSYTIMDRRT